MLLVFRVYLEQRFFVGKKEGNENGGKEDKETVWNEGNEWTLSSGSL